MIYQATGTRLIPCFSIINELTNTRPAFSSINTERKKISFEKKLRNVLSLSSADPKNRGMYGAFWFNNYNCIAANPKILERTMHIKANSVNRNFRDHQFERVGKLPAFDSVFLPDPKNWSIFRDKTNNFQQSQLYETNKLLSWKPKTKKIKISPEIKQKKEHSEIRFHNFNYDPKEKQNEEESNEENTNIIEFKKSNDNNQFDININHNNNCQSVFGFLFI
ncbi:hypothetical protein M9Y10_032301 [Tritrichomonas musculus]|uniref:Initiator binding domain-containing protein n=1 Tax=Tritrichomonas musculus TaxID=1915356 RepID=A0ABR2GZN4_9EUKA